MNKSGRHTVPLSLIAALALVGLVLNACVPVAPAPAAPQVVEKVVTQVVIQEKQVVVTPTVAPQGKTKISVAGWGPGEASFQPIWKEIKATYEKAHPDIEIELIGLAYENLRTQLIVQATGGTAPDIGQVDSVYDMGLASMGALAPLDDLLSPQFKDDVVPSLLENSKFDGKIYAIPQSPVPHILWENTVLAKKAGLDPTAEFKTLDDVAAAARAIKKLGQDDKGNPIWGWSIDTLFPLVVASQTFPILRAYGCSWFDKDGKVSIDAPECVQAVTWFKALVDEGVIGPPGVDARETRSTFARELSGFQVDNTGARGIYRDLSGLGADYDTHWRLVKWPGQGSNPGIGYYYAHTFVVFKQSKVKEEAVKFIEWLLTDPDMYRKYFEATGGPPPTKSLLDKDPAYANPYVQTIKAQMDSWERPEGKYSGKASEIYDFVGHGISQIVLGHGDVAAGLKDTATNLKLLVGQ